MNAIQLQDGWYVAKRVLRRRVRGVGRRRPAISYFTSFVDYKPSWSINYGQAHKWSSLESLRQTFGEIKVSTQEKLLTVVPTLPESER